MVGARKVREAWLEDLIKRVHVVFAFAYHARYYNCRGIVRVMYLYLDLSCLPSQIDVATFFMESHMRNPNLCRFKRNSLVLLCAS